MVKPMILSKFLELNNWMALIKIKRTAVFFWFVLSLKKFLNFLNMRYLQDILVGMRARRQDIIISW
jgi:hypothetical protein